MNFVTVTKENQHLLKTFIENIGEASKTFRYFNRRPVGVIKNHLATLLILENENPITYGHLDIENNIVWLGICVLPQFSGKGYGSKMIDALISAGRKFQIDCIELTVDKDNKSAIKLYEKFNFKKVESTKTYVRYRYTFHSSDFKSLTHSAK
ncbi:hypothetical protein BH11BAC5_BH11BAC5_30060 [soil metagenome]